MPGFALVLIDFPDEVRSGVFGVENMDPLTHMQPVARFKLWYVHETIAVNVLVSYERILSVCFSK
jgi:hypothetical protein